MKQLKNLDKVRKIYNDIYDTAHPSKDVQKNKEVMLRGKEKKEEEEEINW